MSNPIVEQIRKKLIKMIGDLTTEELKCIVEDEYVKTTEIPRFLEYVLKRRTRRFQRRCALWEYKMTFPDPRCKTVYKLIQYRNCYENWDGQETFPGREAKKLKYYMS